MSARNTNRGTKNQVVAGGMARVGLQQIKNITSQRGASRPPRMPKCECGFEICFAKLESGKLVCLDAKSSVYMVRAIPGEKRFGEQAWRADLMGTSFMAVHRCRFNTKQKDKK